MRRTTCAVQRNHGLRAASEHIEQSDGFGISSPVKCNATRERDSEELRFDLRFLKVAEGEVVACEDTKSSLLQSLGSERTAGLGQGRR